MPFSTVLLIRRKRMGVDTVCWLPETTYGLSKFCVAAAYASSVSVKAYDGGEKMIYWDNGATTWPKPMSVRSAVGQAIQRYGANPGRAGHAMAMETAEQVYACREKAAEFFGLDDPSGVVFTLNCTASLNTVIRGLLDKGGRAVCSDLEHNAVCRPLAALGGNYPRYDVAAWSADEEETVEHFRRAICADTKLIVCTHASNVFGVTFPIRQLGALAREYGLLFCVDAAQSAGVLPLDMQAYGIDYLCVAPHKGLYAPMGTGLLLCREKERLLPLVRGGTGSHSLQIRQPEELPDRLESGTPNVAGICGVHAGLRFVEEKGKERIYRHEMGLVRYVFDRLSENPRVRLYTSRPELGKSAPVLSFSVEDLPSEQVATQLNEKGVAVRAGLHCAPWAHTRFGTVPDGTVRLVPSAFSTMEEAEKICKFIWEITKKSLHTRENMV